MTLLSRQSIQQQQQQQKWECGARARCDRNFVISCIRHSWFHSRLTRDCGLIFSYSTHQHCRMHVQTISLHDCIGQFSPWPLFCKSFRSKLAQNKNKNSSRTPLQTIDNPTQPASWIATVFFSSYHSLPVPQRPKNSPFRLSPKDTAAAPASTRVVSAVRIIWVRAPVGSLRSITPSTRSAIFVAVAPTASRATVNAFGSWTGACRNSKVLRNTNVGCTWGVKCWTMMPNRIRTCVRIGVPSCSLVVSPRARRRVRICIRVKRLRRRRKWRSSSGGPTVFSSGWATIVFWKTDRTVSIKIIIVYRIVWI